MSARTESPGETQDTADYMAIDQLITRFYETEPRRPVRVDFGARTHPGKVRPNNEDNYLVVRRRRERDILLTSLPAETLEQPDQVAYTMAVADGMGGHRFGELASLLALRVGWDLGGGEIKWAVKMNHKEADELREKARVFFQMVHDAIQAKSLEEPRMLGMGTTLTVAYSTGPELFILHAGDSRAYLYREGQLHRLTRDHNVAQAMIDTGQVLPGSPEERRMRRVLTNALGADYVAVAVDVSHHRLRDGDRVLLCTDGLTDELEDDEIARVLEEHPEPAEASRVLVDRALDRRGRDNITVVLGRYSIPD